MGEGDGIEDVKLRGEGLPLRGGEPAGGQELLVGGLGGVVALEDLGAASASAEQLPHRAEEVVLEPAQVVEALQDGPGRTGAEAVVADEPAHEQAVALFDPRLIVLSVRPAAGEADPVAPAPAEQGGVDELTAIVAVPLPQREGQARVDVLDGAGDPLVVQ